MRKFILIFFILIISQPVYAGQAKYIILFIGDGMAMQQISATEMYMGALESGGIKHKRLAFTQFPALGMATTYNASSFVTDSASAGTAIASGNKTIRGALNHSPDYSVNYTPITYALKDAGYRIGIVTTVSLNHATPAAFYAYSKGRRDMYEIAMMLYESGFDYFGGGGFSQRKGKQGDMEDIYEVLKTRYNLALTRSATAKLKNGTPAIVVNEVLDGDYMPYEIDRAADDMSLADHTRKAIEMLDNNGGFFLMVEGGNIDTAGHANDAATSVREVIALNDAINAALEFYAKHPKDTLIIVTGDHETGGMSVGSVASRNGASPEKLALQKGSYQRFIDDVLEPYKAKNNQKSASIYDLRSEILDFFGIDIMDLVVGHRYNLGKALKQSMLGAYDWRDEMLYGLYGGNEALSNELLKLFSANAGIGWTSYSHTAIPVPVFAIGTGSEKFNGYYDNTDIYKKMLDSAVIK